MSQQNWPVTFSIGAATYNNLNYSLEEMIAEADALMYAAKQAGKGRLEYKVIS
jgi:diguanylate cyclase (GGDEF)-like protein